jgi:hypothetical protein
MIGSQNYKWIQKQTSNSYEYLPVAYLTMPDPTFITMIVARFVGKESFLNI